MIYLVTFIISFSFCVFSEKIEDRSTFISKCSSLLAVLVPSLLAGIRSFNVGTDIMTYSHWMFLSANNRANYFDYIFNYNDIEIGYSTFVYITGIIFSDEHVLYFLTGLITYGVMFLAIRRLRHYTSSSWSWLVYLLLLYGDTLNAMRQCMAISIAFYAFTYVWDKNYKKYVLITLISLLFHITMIISFVLFGIYLILQHRNTIFNKLILVLGLIVCMLFYNQILSILITIGVLDEKFYRYLSSGFVFGSINPILVRIPFIVVIFYFKRMVDNKSLNDSFDSNTIKVLSDFLFIMCLFEMFISVMREINVSLYRITFIFAVFRAILIGRTIRVLQLTDRVAVKSLFFVLLVAIWWYQNVIQGNNEIYPFVSDLFMVSKLKCLVI